MPACFFYPCNTILNYPPKLYSVRRRRRLCSLLLMNMDVTLKLSVSSYAHG